MYLYTDLLWPKVRDELLFRARYGGFHGSEVRDLIMQKYPGAGASLDRACAILAELEASGRLRRASKPTPTPVQAALNGLALSIRGYRELVACGYLGGLREQFFYDQGKAS